jgi:hypothetical protein
VILLRLGHAERRDFFRAVHGSHIPAATGRSATVMADPRQ